MFCYSFFRCRGCREQTNLSRPASQISLPSLDGIMQIAGMDQYASLRHPDGASDPNLQIEKNDNHSESQDLLSSLEKLNSHNPDHHKHSSSQLPQLTLLPLTSTPEAYDSGHDSTPRTSKHSGMSRRVESGYHSVATVRDSDESSFSSATVGGGGSRAAQKITVKKKRTDKSLCHWIRNPFSCTHPDTEGEVSDF